MEAVLQKKAQMQGPKPNMFIVDVYKHRLESLAPENRTYGHAPEMGKTTSVKNPFILPSLLWKRQQKEEKR